MRVQGGEAGRRPDAKTNSGAGRALDMPLAGARCRVGHLGALGDRADLRGTSLAVVARGLVCHLALDAGADDGARFHVAEFKHLRRVDILRRAPPTADVGVGVAARSDLRAEHEVVDTLAWVGQHTAQVVGRHAATDVLTAVGRHGRTAIGSAVGYDVHTKALRPSDLRADEEGDDGKQSAHRSSYTE